MFRRNLVCFGNELKQDHDLAKVGVEGSSPFARSKNFHHSNNFRTGRREAALSFCFGEAADLNLISIFPGVHVPRSAPTSRDDTQRSSSQTDR